MSEAIAIHDPEIAGISGSMSPAGSLTGGSRVPVRPSSELTDAQLAATVQKGDAGAFDALVGRHIQRAFGVALRLLGQREDAEDLVQEAFLAALEKIDSFDTNRDFSPWFYRILVNRCLNARKSRSRRWTVELPSDAASSVASPLAEAERSELRRHLEQAVLRLPERQRTIVTMFDLEGFSSPEIAEVLGISDGTVRWHLHQARRVLREALEPYARRQA
ncbi:MAG: sigma-70 family RNA polymerase sigma factor [Gemmatimonas sp.]|nr:sigma-70 family RNA polymerase sigma factor [Gemmatimonas sp.]